MAGAPVSKDNTIAQNWHNAVSIDGVVDDQETSKIVEAHTSDGTTKSEVKAASDLLEVVVGTAVAAMTGVAYTEPKDDAAKKASQAQRDFVTKFVDAVFLKKTSGQVTADELRKFAPASVALAEEQKNLESDIARLEKARGWDSVIVGGPPTLVRAPKTPEQTAKEQRLEAVKKEIDDLLSVVENVASAMEICSKLQIAYDKQSTMKWLRSKSKD